MFRYEHRQRSFRIFSSVLACLAILALGIVSISAPLRAGATPSLVSVNLADGATVESQAFTLEFGFSDELKRFGTRLVDGTGKAVSIASAHRGPGASIAILDLPALPPGTYQLSWQADGADGTSLTGEHHFVVVAPATTLPMATTPPPPTTATTSAPAPTSAASAATLPPPIPTTSPAPTTSAAPPVTKPTIAAASTSALSVVSTTPPTTNSAPSMSRASTTPGHSNANETTTTSEPTTVAASPNSLAVPSIVVTLVVPANKQVAATTMIRRVEAQLAKNRPPTARPPGSDLSASTGPTAATPLSDPIVLTPSPVHVPAGTVIGRAPTTAKSVVAAQSIDTVVTGATLLVGKSTQSGTPTTVRPAFADGVPQNASPQHSPLIIPVITAGSQPHALGEGSAALASDVVTVDTGKPNGSAISSDSFATSDTTTSDGAIDMAPVVTAPNQKHRSTASVAGLSLNRARGRAGTIRNVLAWLTVAGLVAHLLRTWRNRSPLTLRRVLIGSACVATVAVAVLSILGLTDEVDRGSGTSTLALKGIGAMALLLASLLRLVIGDRVLPRNIIARYIRSSSTGGNVPEVALVETALARFRRLAVGQVLFVSALVALTSLLMAAH